MSKPKQVEAPKVGRLAGFNVSEWANEYIPAEEVLDIKRGFDLFDHDGGGSIDPRELKTAINSLGIEAKAEAVYAMIGELDKDGSGQIEFDEFFYMMTTRPSQNESRDEIHKVFVTFDSQRTGYVALKDLRKVAKELGELHDDNELNEMIERADYDQDGLVSEDEFYNLLTKKAY